MSHQNSIQKFHRNLGLELLCKQSLSLIKKASFALTVNTFNFFTHKKVSLQTDFNKAAIVLSSPLRLLQTQYYSKLNYPESTNERRNENKTKRNA